MYGGRVPRLADSRPGVSPLIEALAGRQLAACLIDLPRFDQRHEFAESLGVERLGRLVDLPSSDP